MIPVLKSKMGLNDVRFLLSCINVQPPAFSGLQRKLNKVDDHVTEMNTKSMAANQEYVRQVSTMAGCQAKVNVETDAAYNDRPQSGVEAATQSFSPMIEQDTCKKWFWQCKRQINTVQKETATIEIETVNRILVLLKPFPHVNQSWCKKFRKHTYGR